MDKDQQRLLAASGGPSVLYRGIPLFRSFQFQLPKKESAMQTQLVQQVMTLSVYFCNVNDHLGTAAQLMWEHDCGVVPVVNDEGRAVGMVTDRDICMAAYTQGKTLSELSVRRTMSQGLVVCHPEDSIDLAEELMSMHQIRRLPVVNPDGQPVGMLSISDLARAADYANSKGHAGPNGVRLQSTARTLAAVCARHSIDTGPKLA